MLCEYCQKRAACVKVTKYSNGDKTELILCEQCAAEKGMDNSLSFQDFFKGLIDMSMGIESSRETKKQGEPELHTCPECGMTYEEFKQKGKLGCAECYRGFSYQVTPLIKSMHGSTKHKGKTPKKAGVKILRKRECEELKRRLHTAVENEEYEEAARLRDRLREIEQRGEAGVDEMV